MCRFNGRLGQILRCRIFLFVSIWRRCSHISSSSYVVHVELWYQILRTGFQLSGVPQPPYVIPIICFLSIGEAPDTRIAKEFGIFTEFIMLNDWQSMALESCYQHLDFRETDPSQYITDYRGIERVFKRYRVDVLYPKTWLAYSRLTQRIMPSISLLSNQIQAPLWSTLLSSVIVSDLTPHAYSIERLISTCRHSLLTYDSTPRPSLNREYPLCITFQSGAARAHSVICQTLNF